MILHLARAIPRAAIWLRTNQESSGNSAQSDWPLSGGACTLNLENRERKTTTARSPSRPDNDVK